MDEREVAVAAILKEFGRYLTDRRVVDRDSRQLNVGTAFRKVDNWDIESP